VLLDWLGRINPREKAPKDLVTEADLASQRVIHGIIRDAFPEHDFLGEEDDEACIAASDSDFRWVVDPLDGTTNFVHRLQTFAVSIGLQKQGEVIVGVVYDPIADECFSATSGGGALLNGESIRVSDCTSLPSALVAASFSADVTPESDEIKCFLEVLVECQALRRLGSAALNLAYLATGRLDGYWASSVKIWDVAAGVLLVREAGGIVTRLDGGPLDLAHPRFAATSTKELHTELVTALRRATD
jgi:myo-inositol-1(or 4)-monophosphatase